MATSDTTIESPRTTQRIAVLVVHGVGEQHRFEHLESIAANLHKALLRDRERHAHVEVRRGQGEDATTPVIVRWRGANSTDMELHFREVYWADLDEPATWMNWLKLAGWAIAMPGVRRFSDSWYESGAWPEMRQPQPVSWLQSAGVRLQLFIISLLFLIMLISVDVGYWLLRRLSFTPQWLSHVRSKIYDYLGDVKLYQDSFTRCDESIETHGERSRVAIRRRMIKSMVQAACDVHDNKLDGYYIIGHSLGTVVAFNGLMEHSHVLASYLSPSEWSELPDAFKLQLDVRTPAREIPARPPWLHANDAINRRALFAGFRGLMTLGSPLNKFATLWPALVPVNHDHVFNNVPWINIADCQDIVAGKVTLFTAPEQPDSIGGLQIQNVVWPDQWTLVTAHTHYWKAKRRPRLVEQLIPWFEGAPFIAPQPCLSPVIAFTVFAATLVVLAFFPLLLLAYITWLLKHSAAIIAQFMQDSLARADTATWLTHLFDGLTAVSFHKLQIRSANEILIGSVIVLCFAVTRNLWERWRFRPKRAAENPERRC